MPQLRVITNVPHAKITDELLTKASAQFTSSIKKPEKWITTHFLGDQKMTFSGTTDPCAHVYIMSIGNLGTQENLRISAEVIYLDIDMTFLKRFLDFRISGSNDFECDRT